MFFERAEDFEKLIELGNFSIVEMPRRLWPKPERLYSFLTNEKGVIAIEQVRELQEIITKAGKTEMFIFVHDADKMTEAAENAFLKNLEEPAEHVRIVFLTEQAGNFLPTVLSRAKVFRLREHYDFRKPPEADAKTLELAKKLLVSKGEDLVDLAEKLAGAKENARRHTLEIVKVAIELCYKSYMITGNEGFLQKLEKLLKLHESIGQNGHIKLHVVADLI